MGHVYLSAMGVHDFMVLSSCVHVFLSVCVYYKAPRTLGCPKKPIFTQPHLSVAVKQIVLI